jgi:hypothetical protein
MDKEPKDGDSEEEIPARHSTADESDDSEKKKDKDAAVDHASEQSMDGSDPPAW